MKTSTKKTPDGFSSVPGLIREDGSICGSIRISEGAVATIVTHVVASVPGVTRLSGSSFVDNLAEIVGSKRIKDRSIQVKLGESSVSVELSINVAYGVNLPTLCAELQNKIADEIRRLTGLSVGKVNVVVREMEDPQGENADN